MVQMLLAEGMLLCSLFWAFCWLGTGSDEKNIRNFSTYPDEVQKIVKARPELSGNIRQRGPAAIFAGNLLLFTALLFAMGLLTRQEYFAGNFLNTLLLGQALNLFDFLVIDLLGGGTQNGCGFPAPRKVRNYMRTPANTFTLSCGEFFCFWLLL